MVCTIRGLFFCQTTAGDRRELRILRASTFHAEAVGSACHLPWRGQDENATSDDVVHYDAGLPAYADHSSVKHRPSW